MELYLIYSVSITTQAIGLEEQTVHLESTLSSGSQNPDVNREGSDLSAALSI